MAYQWTTGEVITAAKLNNTGGVALQTFPAKTTVNTWTTLGGTIYGATGSRAATIGDNIYVLNIPANPGQGAAYSISAGVFSAIADASTLASYPGISAYGGAIYKAGGQDTSVAFNVVERYNPNTNSWTTLAALPATRSMLRLSPTDTYLYATGGATTRNGTATNVCIQYDPVANSWTTKATMGTARKHHGAEGVFNGVFVVSGYDTGGLALQTTELYTESSNTWSSKASVTSIVSGDTAEAINTSTVFGYVHLIFAGRSAVYNQHTNTWASIATAPGGVGPTGQSDVAIYLIDANFLSTVRRYNPDLPGRYKPASPGVAFVYGSSPSNVRNNLTGQNAATVTFKAGEWLINENAGAIDVLILGG